MLPRPLHVLTAFLAAGAALFFLLRLLSVAGAQPLNGVAAQPILPANSHTDGLIDVLIYLDGAADLRDIPDSSGKTARGAAVVHRLRAAADATQPALIAELSRLRARGDLATYQPLWIVNAIAATVSPDIISTLESLSGVSRVEPDRLHAAFGPPPERDAAARANSGFALVDWPTADADNSPMPWGIESARAPYVWNLLGNRGEGVTIAIVDTGVDWQHPALQDNYRGLRNGEVDHAGNWFNAVAPTRTTPADPHGHGTHVAGTAVGEGTGVAPGAKWIAAAIADENGNIRDRDVLAALQWLLSPDNNPALAPDVVNGSWGAAGDFTSYLDAVRALHAAGIVTVFSTGNTGPQQGTINAPGSYPGVISVGAHDEHGATAWFSSRGPSPLTAERKPTLVAPGTQVLSAYPGGRYALFNGTSMATPHVAGTVALMLSTEPRLSPTEVSRRLAAASGSTHSYSRGWGLLDAYKAVAPLAAAVRLGGRVSGPGGALPGAIVTVTTPTGAALPFATDSQGRYAMDVAPGRYTLRAAKWGYAAAAPIALDVLPGGVINTDIQLEPLPTGTATIALNDATTGAIVDGTLTILTNGLPIPATPLTEDDGASSYTLPAGRYRVEARPPGYHLATAEFEVTAGESVELRLEIASGPRLLLVDSGAWQYRSAAAYYDDALADLDLFADRWTVNSPFGELPSPGRLADYDAVIWTAPFDSPGNINASDVITDYLATGGRLLISGQNIGNFDGEPGAMAGWWAGSLKARWLKDALPDLPLTGAAGTAFETLTLTLNGADSAANQVAPDQVAPAGGGLTQPLINYPDGTAAALLSDRCEPHRLLYFGFGLEGVTGRATRVELLRASLELLLGPQETAVALWQPAALSDFALAAERSTYTVTLHNLNQVLTQTFRIDAIGAQWSHTIMTPTLTLPPCVAGETRITVDVPVGLPPDTVHEFALSAALDPPAAAPGMLLTITHKTPGYVLLVDDDLFFQAEAAYEDALGRLGLDYDLWETGWHNQARGSPPLELLRAYDLVIWFTGYDWHEAISPAESEALLAYLDGGGRLLLSSQDFLYRSSAHPLAAGYLGVIAYQESITPTAVFAAEPFNGNPELNGALPLDYGPYQNFSDGLIPAADADVLFWHDQGSAAATAAAGNGPAGANWRSVFLGFPFETLPAEQQGAAMDAALGYLSDLGDSEFAVSRRAGSPSQARTYTMTIRNSGARTLVVSMSNSVPISLTIRDRSPELVYDAATRELSWRGELGPGQSRAFYYRTAVDRSYTRRGRIDNVMTLRAENIHDSNATALDELPVTRAAATWVNTPDLSGSYLTARSAVLPATAAPGARPTQVITYELVMHNDARIATGPMTATIAMPQSLFALEGSLQAGKGSLRLQGWRAIWNGSLAPGETVTATVALTQTATARYWLPAAAYLDDPLTRPLVRPLVYAPLPHRHYLPPIAAPPD